MRIETKRHYSNEWTAVDDDTYDGPPAPIGSGSTEAEAVVDLTDKLKDKAPRATVLSASWWAQAFGNGGV